MALILEIRDARGHASWRPLDRLPLTLGRALSNDVIVDDPYVDAVHARIDLDDNGSLVIADTGSVNGLVTAGQRAVAAIRLSMGTELRMGRTLLRIRDVNEAVPPALLVSPETVGPIAVHGIGDAISLPPSAANVGAFTGAAKPALERLKHWVASTTSGGLAITAVMLAALAINHWWSNTEKSSGMSVFTTVLGAAAILLLWAAIWAAAARGADRRFHLTGHLAVASVATLGLLVYTIADEWLTFLFPDSSLLPWVGTTVFLGAVAWIVASHLAVPNLLTVRKRWRAGLIVSAVLLVLVGVGTLLDDEEFSDVPVFHQQLKQMPVSLVPSSTMDQFLRATREAKERADRAVKATAEQE